MENERMTRENIQNDNQLKYKIWGSGYHDIPKAPDLDTGLPTLLHRLRSLLP